jgi:hypothetical protein
MYRTRRFIFYMFLKTFSVLYIVEYIKNPHSVGNIILSRKKTGSRNCLVPPCFISETANLLPDFSYLCIFPGYDVHIITISVLNMTGSCNAYTVDNSCM